MDKMFQCAAVLTLFSNLNAQPSTAFAQSAAFSLGLEKL